MNATITRDLVTDLLPAYLSGEASADTKALVESFMKDDPEFARLVKTEAKVVFTNHLHPPTREAELRALELTKRSLRHRTWHLALAILFTATSVGFHFGPNGVQWLWHGHMHFAFVSALLGLFFWVLYFHHGKRLRHTAL